MFNSAHLGLIPQLFIVNSKIDKMKKFAIKIIVSMVLIFLSGILMLFLLEVEGQI